MPRIPVLEPSVASRPVTLPQPQVLRPPEEAFGTEVAAAQERLGQTIGRAGQVASQRLIELQQRNDEQNVLDQTTKFQTDLQGRLDDPTVDENGIPKGFLVRQRNQAKGATPQFDAVAQQMKAQYMQTVTAPELRNQMEKTLDVHLTSAREQVLHHEAAEGLASFKDSLDANQASAISNAATLSDPKDLAKAITVAQAATTGAAMHLGQSPDVVDIQNKTLAAKMVHASVMGVLDQNPTAAQAVFDANKDKMLQNDVEATQKLIDGQKIYVLTRDVWNSIAADPTFRLADGMVDRAKADAYVRSLKLEPKMEYEVMSHLDHRAMVDYSETMRKRQDAERSAVNEIIDAQSKGVPYDQALKIPSKYAWDTVSTANLEAEVTKLYANPQDRFNAWINRQPQPVQAAWAETMNTVKTKYGSSMGKVAGTQEKLSDAAINALKEDCLGKTADQIRDITKTKLDKVVVGPYSFFGITLPINKTETGWKVDVQTEKGFSEAYMKLAKDPAYGFDRVEQAKAFLARNRKAVTPSNVKRALDEALSRQQGQE